MHGRLSRQHLFIYLLRQSHGEGRNNCIKFAGAWRCDSEMVMIIIDEESESYIHDLEDAIKRGDLVIVQEDRLFRDRGCCLIDIGTAYKQMYK